MIFIYYNKISENIKRTNSFQFFLKDGKNSKGLNNYQKMKAITLFFVDFFYYSGGTDTKSK